VGPGWQRLRARWHCGPLLLLGHGTAEPRPKREAHAGHTAAAASRLRRGAGPWLQARPGARQWEGWEKGL